jgi:MFS family permease
MSQIAAAPAMSRGMKPVRRWRAFAVLAVAFFMTVADLAIVNVALPTIGRDLHMAESDLQWVVTGYALTFGGFLLLGGRAADLLGRRRILLAGLTVFTAASLGCGLATAEGFLIAMRFVQGLGAAIVVPAALSIVMNMFPEGAERNRALGAWGAIGASGATVGVIAGGLLTRYAGWQYIFFLNVPIGAAALALAPRVVPESRRRRTRGRAGLRAHQHLPAAWRRDRRRGGVHDRGQPGHQPGAPGRGAGRRADRRLRLGVLGLRRDRPGRCPGHLPARPPQRAGPGGSQHDGQGAQARNREDRVRCMGAAPLFGAARPPCWRLAR